MTKTQSIEKANAMQEFVQSFQRTKKIFFKFIINYFLKKLENIEIFGKKDVAVMVT